MSEAAAEAAPALDPRRNVFRPDLAAKSLYGKVSAPNYAPGFPAQVARSAVPLRSRPVPSNGFETEALFGELVTVYDERDGWAWKGDVLRARRDRREGGRRSERKQQISTHVQRSGRVAVTPRPSVIS